MMEWIVFRRLLCKKRKERDIHHVINTMKMEEAKRAGKME
jgi:hypothetical protein